MCALGAAMEAHAEVSAKRSPQYLGPYEELGAKSGMELERSGAGQDDEALPTWVSTFRQELRGEMEAAMAEWLNERQCLQRTLKSLMETQRLQEAQISRLSSSTRTGDVCMHQASMRLPVLDLTPSQRNELRGPPAESLIEIEQLACKLEAQQDFSNEPLWEKELQNKLLDDLQLWKSVVSSPKSVRGGSKGPGRAVQPDMPTEPATDQPVERNTFFDTHCVADFDPDNMCDEAVELDPDGGSDQSGDEGTGVTQAAGPRQREMTTAVLLAVAEVRAKLQSAGAEDALCRWANPESASRFSQHVLRLKATVLRMVEMIEMIVSQHPELSEGLLWTFAMRRPHKLALDQQNELPLFVLLWTSLTFLLDRTSDPILVV